jgi:hypothetical protein
LRSAALAFWVALLLGASIGGRPVQADQSSSKHASLVAYPQAVLSATDPQSGITVSVEPDGRSVAATDGSGKLLWRTDVIAELGAPYEGEPVVRHVTITPKGVASLVLGKSRSVEADLRTGELTLIGEN